MLSQLAKDVARVNDAGAANSGPVVGVALSLLRNYDPFQAPTHFKVK